MLHQSMPRSKHITNLNVSDGEEVLAERVAKTAAIVPCTRRDPLPEPVDVPSEESEKE